MNYCHRSSRNLFFKEDGDLADSNAYKGGNSGLVQRYDFTKRSALFELEGNLMEDIFDLIT